MFVDYVRVKVQAGNGGNGCVAFRREKYVPFGGPAGGNGGNGGDIIFEADENVSTLVALRYNSYVKAGNGTHGQGSSMHGKNCEPTIIKVPIGTIVKDVDTQEYLADLTEQGQQQVICYGGTGGRGNKAFKSNANKAPSISEKGEAGELREVIVELKLLADVGLIGFPSVGKSTFISMVTNVKPKIAAYPFTTITPNLGVVQSLDGREFVIADMPGLIEGASLGKGLGHQFLKHIERTTVLCHIIDMSGGDDNRNPIDDYVKINNELEMYDFGLTLRPQVVVANKMDLPNASENLKKFVDAFPDIEVFEITAITKDGLDQVLYRLADLVQETPRFSLSSKTEEKTNQVLYKFEASKPDYVVEKLEESLYRISGEKIEKIFLKTNFDQEDSVMRFASVVRKMGIEDELRKQGCQPGDTVQILEYEFELID